MVRRKPRRPAESGAEREAVEAKAPFLARLSLKHPIFVTSLVLAMLFIGFLSAKGLGVDLFPELEVPVVSVVVPYRGAGPAEIESQVVKLLEEELSTIGGVKHIYAQANDGWGLVTVQFINDTDAKSAERQVQTKVSILRSRLPREIDEPVVQRLNFSDQAVVIVALTADLPPTELYDLAKDTVKPRFEQLGGVGKIDLLGGRKREILVSLDKSLLKSRGVSAGQVAMRIAENSSNVPLGKVEEDGKNLAFRTLGEYRNLEQIEDVVVSFFDRPVRVRDLGLVSFAEADPESMAWIDGKPGIVFEIFKQSGENTLKVVDGALKRLEEVNKELKGRKGAPDVRLIRDGGLWVRQNVDDVQETIAIGILLVMVVVYFFLGNFRSTFITGLALPNSLLGAFILMYLAGFTINLMTLLALSLSVGLLIDDAIVVRENIFRHIERGESPWKAALLGTKEVNLAVIATSSVVIAVFLPVGFLSGTVGAFLSQFGLTMCFAMAISLFDALTIAPMLSAYFAGKGHGEALSAAQARNARIIGAVAGAVATAIVGNVIKGLNGALVGALVGGLGGYFAPALSLPFQRLQDRLEGFYGRLLTAILHKSLPEYFFVRWALRAAGFLDALRQRVLGRLPRLKYLDLARLLFWAGGAAGFKDLARKSLQYRLLTLAAALLVFVSSIAAAGFVTFTFIPGSDSTEFQVTLEMPAGTSLERTGEVAQKVDAVVRKRPEIAAVKTTVKDNKANIFVNLKPKGRVLSSQELKVLVREDMKEFAYAKPKVGDVDVSGGNQAPFQLEVKSEDPAALEKFSQELLERMRKEVKGFAELDSTLRPGRPEFQVKLEPLKAGRLGVSTVGAGMELRAQVDGALAGKLREGFKETDIRVRLDGGQRSLEKGFFDSWVPNLNHQLVRLASVASGRRGEGPATINRFDRSRSVEINAQMGAGAGLQDLVKGTEEILESMEKPEGLTTAFVGQVEDFDDMNRSMGLAVLLAFVIMFLVLASLYESFITPANILLAVPLGIAGAFYAFFMVESLSNLGFFAALNKVGLFHVRRVDASINLFSMIGLILLMGLVAKNSILLVDYTLQLVREGLDRKTALLKAGTARLRPILMTSLALFFGTLPLALALNEAGRFRSSMGVGIAGGLVSSTLLTLVVVPAAFEYIDNFRNWFEGLFRKLGGRS